ncbi:MAG: helix-turn-helix domain-containing protein, partial [Burkholderiales bacterium]|nr:helix-turn-helix domain-containing protein [Anaerolineae bacterium]
SAPLRGVERVGLAYQQCREVLHITRRLSGSSEPRPTAYFHDLGYLHALYHAGQESIGSNPYVDGLRLLLEEQGADLFRTLEAYLDAGASGVQTAEALHIHRSTLNYRLQRIVEIFTPSNVELSDPITRTNLQVAIKLLRLFEVE